MKGRTNLKEAVKGGIIDTSSLEGWVRGEKVIISSILNNTAVYYLKGKYEQKFLELLSLVEVLKPDITYLPERPPIIHPKRKV